MTRKHPFNRPADRARNAAGRAAAAKPNAGGTALAGCPISGRQAHLILPLS
jgi:hypothetical protein